MKINKKLFVPFLSSVIGLSIAGGLGGAFAWYQYNSQVTTSFIGQSVADTSILQIGHYEQVEDTPGSGTYHAEMKWGRDYYPYSNQKQKLVPVTFGQLKANDTLREEGGVNKAFGYPNAGKEVNNDYDGWVHIDPNNGFVQYDMYLRALDANLAAKDLDVYLTDVLIEAAGEAEGDKDITQAVRVHLKVEGGTNRLISKNQVTDLPLFGPLDLDADGLPDRPGGYINGDATIPSGDVIEYGVHNEKQTTIAAATIVQSDLSNPDEDYKICETSDNIATPVKITVTIWLEGWDLLKIDAENNKSNIWKPAYSAGVDIRMGMTFGTIPANL